MSPDDFLSRLLQVKRTGPNRWLALCPAHDDRKPSLNVRIEPDGTKLVICRAGCDQEEIRHAMGCEWADFYPEKSTGVYDRKLPRAFTTAEIFEALETEITIVALIACDIAADKPVSKEDKDRVLVASQRILAAKEMTLGNRR